MSSKSVVTATVGYLCLGLTLWMFSMHWAGWFAHPGGQGYALLLPFGVILTVLGILAYQHERVLDAVVFFSSAGLFWAMHAQHLGMVFHGLMHHHMAAQDAAAHGAGAPPPEDMARAGAGYAGWYALVWAVFYFYVWLGSFKAGAVRMLFLLGFWLTPLALALAAWTGAHFFTVLGGYLGLITAILALLISACAIVGRCGADAAAPKTG